VLEHAIAVAFNAEAVEELDAGDVLLVVVQLLDLP